MDPESLLAKELETEILQKLPSKSIFRFKSVCKTWYFLIRAPSFINRYSSTSNPRNDNKILCFCKDPITKTHVISLRNCQTTEKLTDLESPPLLEDGWPSFLEDGWPQLLDEEIENKIVLQRGISILGPVNGVYCIYYRLIERLVGSIILWNPSTRQYKHIFPPIRYPFPFQLLAVRWNPNEYIFNEKNPTGLNVGFGFGHNPNDLKIVVISQWQHFYGPDNDGWHVKIYNLETDSWRTIYYVTSFTDELHCPFPEMHPRFPLVNSNFESSYGFLNGVFHWSANWEYNIDGVLAFNMMDESFKLIKGPSNTSRKYNSQSVWVLKETLCTIVCSGDLDINPCSVVEVWMMKEYGLEDSWTILQSFGPFEGLRLIGIPVDDQIFFCDEKGQLVSYDFEDPVVKEYNVYGLCEILEFGTRVTFGVLRYVETILPLKKRDEINYNEHQL